MACWVMPEARQRRARCGRDSVAQRRIRTGRSSRIAAHARTQVVMVLDAMVRQRRRTRAAC